jgi:predicted nucleic acid-binding protein
LFFLLLGAARSVAIIEVMEAKVYLETTVLSYLTAWPSRDIVIAAHQQVTRDWWKTCPGRFEVVASELVVQEAGEGDEEAARDRVAVLDRLALLEVSAAARDLARQLVAAAAIPPKAADDALHLAIAATNGVEYLVTWNCRHLANATLRERIETACRAAGYQPPIICTPEELLESGPDG